MHEVKHPVRFASVIRSFAGRWMVVATIGICGWAEEAGAQYNFLGPSTTEISGMVGEDFSGGVMFATLYQATTSFTARTMRVQISATGDGVQIQLALYADNAGTPGDLLSTTDAITPVAGWNFLTLASPVSIASGTSYWLCMNNSDVQMVYTNNGSANSYAYRARAFGNWPAAFGTPDDVIDALSFALLATDSTAGPPPLTVTINQAAAQADPTNASPINFTVVFSEAVTGFAAGDVTVSGAGSPVVTGSGTTYNVAVTASASGTVTASIAAGAATSVANGTTSLASTSTDNSVTFDNVAPTVTINQASGQADPAGASTINFTVVFSEAVTGFIAADVTVSGAGSPVVTGSGTTYNVAVTATSAGTVTASIAAGKATDAAGNTNTASTSTDNTVTYAPDVTAPTVTINQATTQADPTATLPVSFTVTFSEAVTGFVIGDITWGGTAGVTTSSLSGTGPTYTASVTAVTGIGTITASIPAGRANDAAGNPNTASTSTDNSVLYNNSPAPVGSITVPQYTTTASVTAVIAASNADSMKVALSGDTGSTSWAAYAAGNRSVALSGEGVWIVMARYKNLNGTSPWYADTVIYDVTAPTVSISSPLPGTMATASWPDAVTGTAADAGSGLQGVQLQIVNPSGQYFDGSAWTATPTWASVSGTTSWNMTIVKTYMNTGGQYTLTARATDNAGNVKTSAVVTVTIDNTQAPTVTVAPADLLVLEGTNATFTATATGNPTYAWYKVKTGGDSLIPPATGATLTISSVSTADSGSQYYCIVTNSKASATSATVTLRVVTAVAAAFSMTPTEGKDSVTVTFTDNSTGSIAQWKWYFGDGDSLVYNARLATVPHTYRDTGEYFPRLTVVGTGPAGTNSLTAGQPVRVYHDVGNPLRITAQYESCTRVSITITRIDSVNTTFPPPFADSIGVWFGRTGVITDTTFAGITWRYAISGTTGGTMTATLPVPAPASAQDTVYRFWAAPMWNSGPGAYSSVNTARLVMTPANGFTPVGRYLGNAAELPTVTPVLSALDSAIVTVGNAATIDTPSVTSVVLSYGFSAATMIKNDTVSAANFLAGIANGAFTWRLSNPDFPYDTQRVYVRAVQLGVNGLVSLPRDTSFIVGWQRPANPFTLSADSASASQVFLHWNSAPGFDSVRVLSIMAPDTIPLGAINEGDVGRVYTATVPEPMTATSLAVSGLENSTDYRFAIQVKKDLQWSDITLASRASITTESFDPADLVDNTITIDSLWFDAATNLVNVRWSVVQIPTATLDVKITCATDSSLTMSTTAQSQVASKTITNTGPTGSTTLDLGSLLRFGTKYYVGLWLRSTQGPWAAPLPASFDTLRTPSYTWQAFWYFQGSDTTSAFNGKVLVRKDPNALYEYPSVLTRDTIQVYQPSAVPTGMVQAGLGFTLGQDPVGDVLVGISYDSVPAGATIGDLGIYWDSAGTFLAVHGRTVDYANHLVWVPIRYLQDSKGESKPLVVMADLTRPVAAFLASDTAEIGQDRTALSDTATITDNVGNVRWKLVYAKDEEAFRDEAARSAGGYACGTCPGGETLILNFPAAVVTSDVGVRALLILSDGAHTDTINVSHRVRRTTSDAITTEAQAWVPVFATATLDTPDVQHALRGLAEAGQPWEYDNTRFRIYHCEPDFSPTSGEERWVEWSAGVDSLFRFTPGRVFWVKTREQKAVELGAATTLSLKAPWTIQAPSNAWTDIAPPFKFSTLIGDLLDGSQGAVDSLEFYDWVAQNWGSGTRYYSSPKFSNGIPGPNDRADSLESKALVSYSVFNLSASTVFLRFPPTPVSMSRYLAATPRRRSAQDGWSVRVVSMMDDGMQLSPVYCGFRPSSAQGVRMFPLSPSFEPFRTGVYDRATAQLKGHSVVAGSPARGYVYEIGFSNASGKERTFNYRVETPWPLPGGFTARILSPGSAQPADGALWQDVTVGPDSRESRMVVVGDAGFIDEYVRSIAGLRCALVGSYPNPFRNRLRISFELPGLVRMGEVRFVMYDMQGRRAWSAAVKNRLTPGAHSAMFANLPPAGAYLLTMTAIDENGRVAGRQSTKVLSVR